MSKNNVIDKKKALLAYKEKILEEIQYYERSIDDFRANYKNKSYFEDGESSDPEDYFPTAIDAGPEVPQLKLQQSMLKTCLQATQELTSLTVLQSEVNVLVQDPQFEGETQVTAPGTWKEVTAECRVDLVPFIITFYMHTPSWKFAPTKYRGLQITLVKSSHEVELAKSVLNTLKRPSDAVEVVRSYALAYRSRRTTLAKLAHKYATSLFMEPHPEGGFILKCANLLEISWRLENKWSPVAPFHHKMKFDLEYMDESYVKIITQAHKQLLDPSIQTDERTLLLSKIITTCLEARGPVDSESDLESRQTETQVETELKDKDSEVMAPPKSLPKKTKKIAGKDKNDIDMPKDKTVAQKRSMDDENAAVNAKKLKVNEETVKKSLKNKEKGETVQNDGIKNLNDDGNSKKVKNTAKKNLKRDVGKENPENNEQGKEKKNSNEVTEVVKNAKNTNNVKQVSKNTKLNDNVDDNSKKNKVDNVEGNKKTKNDDGNTKIAKKRKIDDNIEDNPKKTNDKGVKNYKNNEKNDVNSHEKGSSEPKKAKNNVNVDKNNKQSKGKENTETLSKKDSNANTANEGNKKKKQNTSENIDLENIKEINKNIRNSDNPQKKLDKKSKMSIANDKKFDLITKKQTGNIERRQKTVETNQAKDVANSKSTAHSNDENNKNTENNIANKKKAEPKQSNKEINAMSTDTVNKVTEKNANNNKNKDKITNINKVAGKSVKDKQTTNVDKSDKVAKNTEVTKNKAKLTIDSNKPEKSIKNAELTKNKPITESNKPEKSTKNTDMIKDAKSEKHNNKKTKQNDIENINLNRETVEKNYRIKQNNKNNDNNTNKKNVDENVQTKTKNNNINNKTLTKITTKTVRNIYKTSIKNPLKLQISQKDGKTKISTGNTKLFSGNTEKENGGKVSKIPQKKMSPNSENKLKKNMLRISPRILPSKFKTVSQDNNIKNLMKNTNIPNIKEMSESDDQMNIFIN